MRTGAALRAAAPALPRGRLSRAGLAALCGAALGLGHSPYDLPWLALVALPVLFRLWAASETARAAALTGWAAGVGFFALTLSWIVEPFLVDIARHGFLAPPAVVSLSGGLALLWGLAFLVARRLVADPGTVRGALALAGALGLVELSRAYLLTGFPWALAAYAWVDTPLAHAAAVLGPHGLSAAIFVVGFTLGLAPRPAPTLAAVVLFAAVWLVGAQRLAQDSAPDTPLTMRVVQPNAAQHLKWLPEMIPVFWQRLLDLSAAPGTVDAVVWPEGASAFLLDDRPDLQATIAAWSAAPHTLIGINDYDDEDNVYSLLASIGTGGAVEARYAKHHLVPFGEYIPKRDFLRSIGLGVIADGFVGSFTPGPGPRLLQIDGLPPFQPLICYEAIFPHEVLTGADRPQWLLQITNDAWFGEWSGPYQHLAQARMRAIEQGLPLVRSANTGVSAIIDARGAVRASVPLNTAGHADAALPGALPATPYAATGDWTALAALLAILGVAGWRRGG